MSRTRGHHPTPTGSSSLRTAADGTRLVSFGALVASAAFHGLGAAPAAAAELSPQGAAGRHVRRPHAVRLREPMPLSSDTLAVEPADALLHLDIPPAPVTTVIDALQQAARVRIVLASDSLGLIDSPGIVGVVTLEQALQAIVEGTGIGYRRLSANDIVLDVAAVSESVSVQGVVARIASPKYNAPLRDIPQTIEVIPRAAMESQGVTTLSEALRNVPGITLQAGEGGGASNTAGDMFNMRGFNASNSLFVDNVRDDGLVSRDVFNVEQVEVFMGPTGSDVGRGTAAGYVNMQTKTPHLRADRSGTLTRGTADQRRVTVDINQPVARHSDRWIGTAAFRVNALWQDSGVAGRDLVFNRSQGVAPSIGLGLATHTRVTASAQLLRQHNLPDYGIPAAAWHASLLAPTVVQSRHEVDSTNYYGSPSNDADRAEQRTVTGRVERDLGERWTLSNQTRYNRTHRDAIVSTVQSPTSFAPDTELVTVARQGNIRENTIASNQTALSGRVRTGPLEHRIASGVEFTREQQFSPAYLAASLGTRAPVNIYAPNPSDALSGFAPTLSAAYAKGDTTTQAAYAFDSVGLGSRVQVNGGLRVEHYATTFRSVDASNVTTADLRGDDTLLSGKAGLVVRLAPTANLYASYGTAVTPPGAANFSLSPTINNQNNPNVKPQTSANTEVGAKVDVAGGRLSLSGSVFRTINENVLFTVDAAAVPPVYNQDDKQQVNGVALGAAGQITPRWSVLASVGYLDTASLTQNSANNGKRLTLSPKYSGSIWSSYRLPKGWTLGGGLRATDAVFVNAANTITAPGYHIVDALAEYAVNRHLTLRVNVYNVTNEVYIRNVNNNGGRYNPGSPRTAQVTSVLAF